MDTVTRALRDPRGRLSALLLAVVVTGLVFTAINLGFTPQASPDAARALGLPALSL